MCNEGEALAAPGLTASRARRGYPPPAYAWYVVCVLGLAYIVSILDRHILVLLVEPIKRDMGISDTQSLAAGVSMSRIVAGPCTRDSKSARCVTPVPPKRT